MKSSIKKFEAQVIKNADKIKGGQGGFGNGYVSPSIQGQTQQAELL